MKKRLSILLVCLAAALWGIIGLFVRYYGSLGLSSMQIVAIRLFLSAVIFSVFVLIFDRKLYRIKLKDLWIFLGSGIISVAIFTFFYFRSIALSSLSVASILLYTAPTFVMLFSLVFFREKLTVKKVVSLVLAFLGCMLTVGVFDGHSGVSAAGLLFGLGSGLCYALYSIFSRFALDRGYSPITVTLYTFLFSGISSLFFIDPRPVIAVLTKSVSSALFGVLFAVASCVLPYLFYTLGLKNLRSSTASIIATLEPVVATVVGALAFSEAVPFPLGLFGIALVVSSVVLINLPQKSESEKSKTKPPRRDVSP